MKITINLEELLAAELQRRADESNRSFEEVADEAIRTGIHTLN